MPLSALIILMNGFEEIEAITPIDLLRRADIKVITASREQLNEVKGAHNVMIQADTNLESALQNQYDAIILPGGPGVKELREDERILKALQKYNKENKIIGAICAAPLVLKEAGILESKRFTAHFSVEEELPNRVKDQLSVTDGNLITGNGPGGAIAFSLALIKKMQDENIVKKITEAIGLQHSSAN